MITHTVWGKRHWWQLNIVDQLTWQASYTDRPWFSFNRQRTSWCSKDYSDSSRYGWKSLWTMSVNRQLEMWSELFGSPTRYASFGKEFMSNAICSCICDGIHVASIFEYLDHQMTMNRMALISIGTNDRELRIGLEISRKSIIHALSVESQPNSNRNDYTLY